MFVRLLSLALASPALSHAHVGTSAAGADDWPGWRGADRSGVAEGAPPTEWSEEENVRWKAPLPGHGLSSPIIVGDLVLVTSSVGTGRTLERRAEEGAPDGERGGRRDRRGREMPPLEEQVFLVLAFERASGASAWERRVNTAMPHQGTHPDGSYAAPTMVTDGERVYASFGSFGLYALSLAGEVLWSKDLGDLTIQNGFGEGSSPVLCGDLLIQNWDHEGDSFLVAMDKRTGEERWRTPRAGGTSWCTPLTVERDGRAQIVIGGPRTVAYDAATGREVWSFGETPSRGGGAIASPVALDELILVAGGGRTGEMRALIARPAGSEDDLLLWSERADVPHIPSPLVYHDKLYLLKQNSGVLSVLDAKTGRLEYGPERLDAVANVYASPVVANGRLYVAGRDGIVEVLALDPQIETVAVNTLEDAFDASPAVAGDAIFLRGRANLYCIAAD